MGWVYRRRDLGGIVFLELRDREGVTQIAIDPQGDLEELTSPIRAGHCIGVQGTVFLRTAHGGSANKNLPTGEIEIRTETLEIYNGSEPLPFQLGETTDASEVVRLQQRYLDLRRPPLYRNLALRSRVFHHLRNHLAGEDFLEVETPILMKSTPEGARDYLVPSRVSPGSFYALPQSPQIYKQLLMVGGIEKYYQIARCFRDEDLRADRQPEFTQLDLEMSFVNRDDVQSLLENALKSLFQEVHGVELGEFPSLTYDEAMERYGEDKPDLRYGLELVNLNGVFANTSFNAFKGVLESGGVIKGIRVPGEAGRSKSWIKGLEKKLRKRGAKGLAWFKRNEEWDSPIAKFLSEDELAAVERTLSLTQGDLALVVADGSTNVVNRSLSFLRRLLAEETGVIDPNKLSFLWINDFPVASLDDNGELEMMSNPFTMPNPEHLDKLETAPEEVRSLSYDLVLNGVEMGSGSIRISDPAVQARVFAMLGMEEAEIDEQFGFFRDALKYGAPPHGGFGLGLDRLVMIMAGEDSLRDVIAFPKTMSASCPMTQAPSPVEQQHLDDLRLAVLPPESNEKA
jgi:aspartyl-tRNA synthetase